MNHGHTITDNGHVHGVTDNGHSHTLSDPGHTHNIRVTNNVGTELSVSAGTTIWQVTASNTPLNNSGATSYVVGTNAQQRYFQNQGSTTGITLAGSGTGISIANNGTSISVNGMTGSTGTAGGATGADATRPRNIAMLVIIKI
jgi:hypothetical protein